MVAAREYSHPERSEEPATPDSGRKVGMMPAAFVGKVGKVALQLLALSGEQQFELSVRGRLLKLWRGEDPSIHYELALHDKYGQIELGLHMESSPERNEALYREFDRALLDIQAELGPCLWLERWDRGWVRLYETHPYWPLDDDRLSEISYRLVAVVKTVQPIYEAICDRLGDA